MSPDLAAPALPEARGPNFPLLCVSVAGFLYSLWLVAHISGEVFMSGDGGVKALLTKQIASGTLGVQLHLTAPASVENAWRSGLYPFGPPFLYPSDKGYTVAFPFLFEAACAPFYRLFGFRGLYVVPLGSLWLTWLLFARSLRKLSVAPWAGAAGMAALVFASPLTLYGVMFWEHTLGALLCYVGIDFLATQRVRAWSPYAAFAAGFVSGASFLVRPEGALLVLCLALFGLLANRGLPSALKGFIAGACVATLTGVAVNIGVYGYVLGAHGRQIVEASTLAHQVGAAFGRGTQLWTDTLVYCPFVVFAFLALVVRRTTWRWPLSTGPYGLLLPCIAFLLLLPLIVPNAGGKQIGPRYVLVAIPGLALLATVALSRMAPRRWLVTAFGVSVVAGLLWDTLRGGRTLLRDYEARSLPALEFLRRDPGPIFVTNTTYAAQELEAVIPSKLPLLIKKKEDEALAVATAVGLGQRKMVFATFLTGQRPPSLPGVTVSGRHRMGDWSFFVLDFAPPPQPEDSKAEDQ
jgi:hypothetical protein